MVTLVAEERIHFGEHVALRRARLNLKGRKLAELVGCSPKTITNIERKPTPDGINPTVLAGLARVFKMDESRLLEEWKTEPVPRIKLPPKTNGHSLNAAGLRRIGELPVKRVALTTVKASGLADSLPPGAGDADDDGNRFVYAHTHSTRVFAAVVDGNCMEPVYPDGSIVIFSYDAVEVEGGLIPGSNYYVQCNGGREELSTFKQCVREEREDVIFRCINATEHPQEIRIKWDHIARVAKAVYVTRPT
jgi:transcriptional regulator with XRE-family HTH domain